MPPIDISFKDYDGVVAPIYVFNENEKLYQISYRIIFKDAEINKYKKSVLRLINNMDKNPNAVKKERDFDNFPELNWKERVEIRWKHVKGDTTFRIQSRMIKETIILDLIVSDKVE